MFTYEAILATVLLSTAPDVEFNPREEAWLALMRPSILAVALDQELLYEREYRFWLHGSILGDFELLRQRWKRFAAIPFLFRDGPALPTLQAIQECLAANRRYAKYLETFLELCPDHSGAVEQAMQHNDWLHSVWGELEAIRTPGTYHEGSPRDSIARLVEWLGYDNYMAGRWPPHVPLWAIPER